MLRFSRMTEGGEKEEKPGSSPLRQPNGQRLSAAITPLTGSPVRTPCRLPQCVVLGEANKPVIAETTGFCLNCRKRCPKRRAICRGQLPCLSHIRRAVDKVTGWKPILQCFAECRAMFRGRLQRLPRTQRGEAVAFKVA
jgi:hypothetical protein